MLWADFFVAEREEKRFETKVPYMQVSVSPNAFQQYNRKGDLIHDKLQFKFKTMASLVSRDTSNNRH